MADANNEQRNCIRCGSIAGKDDVYCGVCGAPVINRCLDSGGLLGEPCSHINDANASFCTHCGSYTAFYKAGLLFSSYPENRALHKDELEEMNWFSHRFFWG